MPEITSLLYISDTSVKYIQKEKKMQVMKNVRVNSTRYIKQKKVAWKDIKDGKQKIISDKRPLGKL